MREIGHFIGGHHVPGNGARRGDVFQPMDGTISAKVAFADSGDVDRAVETARLAQPGWAAVNPQRRAEIFMRFLQLAERDDEELSRLIAYENGKTIPDARGDLQRGLDVVAFCLATPHMMKGEYSQGAGKGIDVYAMRQPLGVVAGITPFNFPAMIPLWKIAPALACGNACLLKPSERAPGASMRIVELFHEAGLPEGVLNLVNGDKETVDAILDHPDIAAVGFVGSTAVAEYIYGRGCANGKRMQCFGGAKNHLIIMPDANMDHCVDGLIGAGYGSAGQRCMAISVVVPVGEETAKALVEKLVPRVENLKIGPSTDENADFGPLVTRDHVEKIRGYIDLGLTEGATLAVDGRDFRMQGYEDGFYMGGCLFDHVTPDMRIYKEEIFGPVLSVVRAGSYENALALVNGHQYGNGAAIFTRNGNTARDFTTRVQAGMVGINVPIPVPVAYYTFGGWKASAFGDLNQYGSDGFRFYSKTKTVTARWSEDVFDRADFTMPVMD